MDVREFDFDLPSDLIAQEPAAERSAARLLHLHRDTGLVTHTCVTALPDLLRAGDLVVINNTKVFPARLLGHRVPSGGTVECLLVRKVSVANAADDPMSNRVGGSGDLGSGPSQSLGAGDFEEWEALMHPGQKLKPGARMVFEQQG